MQRSCLLQITRAAALAGAAGVVACSSSEPLPGQVIAVVTTDLAVPSDVDTLYWEVSVAGAPTSLDEGPFPLASGDELPATIAVVSGSEDTEVVIRLWAYKQMTLRVQREATLSVPREGVRLIAMPLDWLCSDANPAARCGPGLTCRAGECVDTRLVTPSLSYPANEACFDTLDCFAEALHLPVPELAPDGSCTLPLTADASTDLNVALRPKTAQVGNYGVCQPLGECLVTLDRDTPEGFQRVEDGVLLPPAVCGGMRDQLAGISVTTSCATKSRTARLCTAPDTCAAFEGSPCLPEQPAGYSCSGQVTPFGLAPDVVSCDEAAVDELTERVRYCCSTE